MVLQTLNRKIDEVLTKEQKEFLEKYVDTVTFHHEEDQVVAYFRLQNGYTFSTVERKRLQDVPSFAYEAKALLQGIQLLEMAVEFVEAIKEKDGLSLRKIRLVKKSKDDEVYGIETDFGRDVAFEHVFAFEKPNNKTDLMKSQMKAVYNVMQILGICVAFAEHELKN